MPTIRPKYAGKHDSKPQPHTSKLLVPRKPVRIVYTVTFECDRTFEMLASLASFDNVLAALRRSAPGSHPQVDMRLKKVENNA